MRRERFELEVLCPISNHVAFASLLSGKARRGILRFRPSADMAHANSQRWEGAKVGRGGRGLLPTGGSAGCPHATSSMFQQGLRGRVKHCFYC